MPQIDPRLLRGPALSLASQGVGLLQLGVLLWRTGATNATDVYFYLFNLGLLSTQILTVGVLYPMLLTEHRITRTGTRRLMRAVPVLAAGSVAAGAAWLAAAGRLPQELLAFVVLSALNATVQSMLWQRAMSAAAAGHSEWEAAVALPANVLATLVIAYPWATSEATVTAMMFALLLGNSGFLGVAVLRRVGIEALDGLPTARTAPSGAPWWFVAKSGTSYGGLMVLQSLAVLLPASALTFLAIGVKIVGAVAASLVNAVMPRLVHQATTSQAGGRIFLRRSVALVAPTGVAGVVLVMGVVPEHTLGAAVIALWLVATVSATTAQRLAFRFLSPSVSRVNLVVVPLTVGLAAASGTLESFTLVTLLCAYAFIDAMVGFVLLVTLRDWFMASASGVVAILVMSIWGTSLLGGLTATL